jgi:hypothetical protein
MLRIADGGGSEQPDGSFLDQRTHTPDPYVQVETMRTCHQVDGGGPDSVGIQVDTVCT